VTLNLIVGHAALSTDCRLVPIDGKRVELGRWRACAEAFIGPSIVDGIATLRHLQSMMDSRYDVLLDAGRRKIMAVTGLPVVVVVSWRPASCGPSRTAAAGGSCPNGSTST
jgi:DNA segregation ATPase FtsK/SpoIIIE, S-DNA-T family